MNAPVQLDIALDPQEAYDRGRVDINFFAALAMPEVFIFALPSFYISVWQILVHRDPKDIGKILRFALGLPRGHAKTTFIKIILAWLIVYDRASFIVIICANEGLAENLLSDLDDLLSSPNMEAVYGEWAAAKSTDTKELKKSFYHGRSIILAAKGAGSALRGLNIKNRRPDVIFCDDMQTRENDESETERNRLLRWFTSTLIKILAPRGDRLVIFVGNMYSEHCMLKQFQNNSKWVSLVTGAILENGEPLWPELHPLEDLMESFQHDASLGLEELWFAEIMNDPKSLATTLLPSPLPMSPIAHDEIATTVWDSTFITIDPAGYRNNSDDNQIIVHGVQGGKTHIIDGSQAIMKPDELIKEALRLAFLHGCCLIGIESVAYQQTLAFWLRFFMDQLHITDIEIVELSPHGRTKESRIRQQIQEFYAENYFLTNADIRAAYVWQASQYKVGRKQNKDDLLDACAYGLDIRNEFWHYLREPSQSRALPDNVAVQFDNTPF